MNRFTDTPLTPRDGRTPSPGLYPGHSRSRHGSGTRSRHGSGSRLEEGSRIEESTSWQVDGSNHSIGKTDKMLKEKIVFMILDVLDF